MNKYSWCILRLKHSLDITTIDQKQNLGAYLKLVKLAGRLKANLGKIAQNAMMHLSRFRPLTSAGPSNWDSLGMCWLGLLLASRKYPICVNRLINGC
jgi:hypothetical protein